MKQGDLAPKLTINTNADVTGATSKVAKMRRWHTTTVLTKTLTTVGDPTLGDLEYQWVAPDTDIAGNYYVEAVITYADGRVQRFPGGHHLEFRIGPKVG